MVPENPSNKLDRLLSPLILLSSNWISRIGVIVVTTATVFFLFLLPSMLTGDVNHPYLGILSFLILPGVFFAGLALIPIGLYFHRRRGGARMVEPSERRWSNPVLRKLVIFIAVTTAANLLIASQLTYRAVHFMDSTQFCGQACHTVMEPEFTAYQNSPHSRVNCVQCHIGPGAEWMVKAKISGLRQVFKVALGTYSRPTPAPVHDLRPARDTCEQCHWPQKYGTDRVRVVAKHADDETNTASTTVLLMRIGGGHVKRGIHGAHLEDGVVIRYRHSDDQRQTIPWVEHARNGGKSTVYLAAGAKKEEVEKLPLREMDCIDCHNRPTHTFETPEGAIDRAMEDGRMNPKLPFAKKTGVEILKKEYKTESAPTIATAFIDFYRSKYPDVYAKDKAAVESSAANLLAIYRRNVFPDMKVTWGTYPNNIGHVDFPGCFRCHDNDHTAGEGKTIAQDCNGCHQVLAMEETDPKVLADLGYSQ